MSAPGPGMVLDCGCVMYMDGRRMLCPTCERAPGAVYYLCDCRLTSGGRCGKAFTQYPPPTVFVCPECA